MQHPRKEVGGGGGRGAAELKGELPRRPERPQRLLRPLDVVRVAVLLAVLHVRCRRRAGPVGPVRGTWDSRPRRPTRRGRGRRGGGRCSVAMHAGPVPLRREGPRAPTPCPALAVRAARRMGRGRGRGRSWTLPRTVAAVCPATAAPARACAVRSAGAIVSMRVPMIRPGRPPPPRTRPGTAAATATTAATASGGIARRGVGSALRLLLLPLAFRGRWVLFGLEHVVRMLYHLVGER